MLTGSKRVVRASVLLDSEGVITMTFDISKGVLLGIVLGSIFGSHLAPYMTLLTVAALVIYGGIVGLKK